MPTVEDERKALEPTFTCFDVAQALQKTPQFVRVEVHAGRLKASRVGIELRFRRGDLEEYLASNVATGPDPRRDPRRHDRRPTGRPPRKRGS